MKTSSGLRGLNVKDAPISSSMHFLRDNSGCAAPPLLDHLFGEGVARVPGRGLLFGGDEILVFPFLQTLPQSRGLRRRPQASRRPCEDAGSAGLDR
jgi:hypothetical protein